MPLQLFLLGGCDCRSGTGDMLTFPTSKVRALFAYLATNPDQGQRRDKLADRPGGLQVDVAVFLKLAADGTPETMERAAGL
jgi:hypothetical protein